MSYKVKKAESKRRDKNRHEIIKEIAEEENISIREVSDILQYTYGFISSVIRKGDGEGVRIPYWGAFAVKPFQKKKLEVRNKVNEKDRAENKRKYLQRREEQKAKAREKERSNSN